VIEGSKPSTEDRLNRGRIGASHAMIVKVSFRNFPDGLKIGGLETLLKGFVHLEVPFV
jgi:hypothetical protein